MEVANYVNLKTCGPRDLEDIYGIGPKTARAFICWSRSDVSHAILDTHILKWLKQQGVDRVPKSTPTGISYMRLEKEFLSRVPASMTPAEFDLSIWTSFAR
jgi:thermostable 8-oxoguanine DNA glycosylase